MRMGIAIDATVDLPRSFIEEHDITVMPITIKVDGQIFMDDRDPVEVSRFLAEGLGTRGHAAETEPCSIEEVRDLFLNRLVLEKDCVFCLTIMTTRSAIHENVVRASFAVLRNYHSVRDQAGIQGPFLLRVIDTRNLFAGSAPVVVEAVRLMKAGNPAPVIRERLSHIAEKTYGYMLPRDLHFLRARAKKKGDNSVGMFSVMLGSALDIKPFIRAHQGDTAPVGKVRGFEHGAEALFNYLTERVRTGLLVPALCLSYGGDLNELAKLPGYDALREVCSIHDVALLEAPMSLTGMVNVGEGALAVGFVAEDHPSPF